MPSRIVRTDTDRDMAATWILNMKPPFRIGVKQGSLRSLEQNDLAFLWYREIADQRGDVTPAEVRAEMKLIFGVPIMRSENDDWRKVYDRKMKGWTYADKLEVMRMFEIPVTRQMNITQMSRYLNCVADYAAKNGFQLTQPMAA